MSLNSRLRPTPSELTDTSDPTSMPGLRCQRIRGAGLLYGSTWPASGVLIDELFHDADMLHSKKGTLRQDIDAPCVLRTSARVRGRIQRAVRPAVPVVAEDQTTNLGGGG